MSVEVQAAEWLQRRRFWVWSAEDQSQFDEWLANRFHIAWLTGV